MADELDPSQESSDYEAMKPYWEMVDAILGGAETMRAAGQKYLPKFANERPIKLPDGTTFDPYLDRLTNAPFTNLYADVSRNLSSKPFEKPVKLAPGAPDWAAGAIVDEKTKQRKGGLVDNIDGAGHNLHVFGSDVFRTGVDKGITYILVDYTNLRQRADGRPLNLAEERKQGARPYWVHIHPECMIAIYSELHAGTEVIYHARIRECVTRLTGFSEEIVNRIRVLNREPIYDETGGLAGFADPEYVLYEEDADENKKATWTEIDRGPITIGEIAIVPFITGERIGASWRVRPELKNIAHLQVFEFQQEANLRVSDDQTGNPMLVGEGIPARDGDNKDIVVPSGPRAVLFSPPYGEGKHGTWKYIEIAATSLTYLKERLQNTRTEIRDLGMQPLTQANLTVITTGQVALKANSTVHMWTVKFKDALDEAWRLTAKWLKEPIEPTVEVYQKFAAIAPDSKELDALQKAYAAGAISRRTYQDGLKRLGVLSDDFDPEEDDAQRALETEGLEAEEAIDPVTGQPIKEPEPAQ